MTLVRNEVADVVILRSSDRTLHARHDAPSASRPQARSTCCPRPTAMSSVSWPNVFVQTVIAFAETDPRPEIAVDLPLASVRADEVGCEHPARVRRRDRATRRECDLRTWAHRHVERF